jgi:protein-L-isoaspartate O-methyltransferase
MGRRGLLLAAPFGVGGVAVVLAALLADLQVLVAVTGLALLAALAAVGTMVVVAERRIRATVEGIPAKTAGRVVAALPPAPEPIDQRRLAKRVLKPLDKMVRREYSQIEQLLALYHEVSPPRALPPLRGWAASPDYQRSLYSLVREHRPQLVVECGSGSSSLVIARALQLNGTGRLVSLEHLAEHAETARGLLRDAGLDDVATVVHAPLVEHRIGDDTFSWYDVTAAGVLDAVGLVAVDGPPRAVGPMARYPALPLLAPSMAPGARLLLDDADRPEELETLERWERDEPDLTWARIGGEKGTVLVQRGQ